MILAVCLALAVLAGFSFLGGGKAQPFLSRFDPQFSTCLRSLLLVLGINLGMMVFYAAKTLPAKTDVTYPESSVVYSAERSAQTGRLYAELSAPPFSPTPYGPLFYSALQLVRHVAGSRADQIRLGARILVWVCYLLIPMVVFALLRKMGWSLVMALLGSLSSTSAYFFHRWNVSARPDLPALLLSVLAVCFVCWQEEPATGNLVLAGCVCAAAVLFKQSFLAAPLAITAGLMAGRRLKSLCTFLASAGLSGSAVLIYYIARGEPVIRQMLLVGSSPLDLRSAIVMSITYLATGFGLLMAAFGCGGFWIGMTSDLWRARLLGYYFFFSAVVAGVTLLQAGGDCNYFLEVWAAAALLLPLAMFKIEQVWEAVHPALKLSSLVVLFLLFGQQAYSLKQFAKRIRDFDVAPLKDLRVLSTLPYLSAHGKDPQILDGFLLNVAEKHGLWSAKPVLQEIARQEFDVVFVLEEERQPAQNRGFDMLSPTVLSSLRSEYTTLCRTATQAVLLPSSRQVTFSAEDASRVLGETCYLPSDNHY